MKILTVKKLECDGRGRWWATCEVPARRGILGWLTTTFLADVPTTTRRAWSDAGIYWSWEGGGWVGERNSRKLSDAYSWHVGRMYPPARRQS